MNNPYHSLEAREFLVKLRVDFVGDLKKSSVMGYQVTQIRRKPYGKNVMLHFKLERWMDYGPTIAAAFAARSEEMNMSNVNGSNNRNNNNSNIDNSTNDVASLRKIILGCMKNARDAALVAQRYSPSGRGGGEREVEQPYRGRYTYDDGAGVAAGDGESNSPVGSPVRATRLAYPGGAESSARRRIANPSNGQDSNYNDDEVADQESSTTPLNEPPIAAPQPIDLLG